MTLSTLRGKSEFFRLTGPISYQGARHVQQGMTNLRAGLAGLHPADAFITAVTPTTERKDQDILDFYASLHA